MQKILSAAEMREVDNLTTKKYGIPSILLMENAAQAAARIVLQKCGGSVADKTVLIFCGKGNNGGDGAALARILWTLGADVEVCLIGKVKETKGDARKNFDIIEKISDKEGFNLTQSDLAFEEISTMEEWLEYDSLNFHSDDPDILIDALFGTGLTRPLDELHEQIAAYIYAFSSEEDSSTLVVSLDIPSGLDADKPDIIGVNTCAHVTITFTAPKFANVFPPASNFNGELHTVNIGSPCELIDNSPSQTFVAERCDAHDWLCKTRFTPNSYKNKRGHALLIAGSKEYTGAAVLAGNAAMLSGAGISTVATSESVRDVVASKTLSEVIVRTLPESKKGSITKQAYEYIESLLHKIDALGIGCGLSTEEKTAKDFVRTVIEKRETPIVVDANGLNALSPFKIEGSELLPLILTPHEGEFMRLLGTDDKEAIKDRVKAVRDFATKHKVILVLKGERNLIGHWDGRVVINPTGNSGLGKAGSGDTLTGIITGFIAQAVQLKLDIFEAVVAAIYISGYAADLAAEELGKHSMLASDVRGHLSEAIRVLSADEQK